MISSRRASASDRPSAINAFVELDSNSPTEFSKHIIFKKWNVLVSV